MKLILASSSPRRAGILRNAGFEFEIHPAHVNESLRSGELPQQYVLRLAEAKARAALEELKTAVPDEAFVIGADTTVIAAGEILGKPESGDDARRMLHLLSGKTHEVITGVAVLTPRRDIQLAAECTRVTFANLTADEIENYIASGEPFDKAGAYGIQGLAGKFIPRIEGCYFNVMGLPLARLYAMLRAAGFRQ